jgi:mannonate dehydratase
MEEPTLAEKERMRLAIGQLAELTDDVIRFAKQLGITDIQMNGLNGLRQLPGAHRWEFRDLLLLSQFAAERGTRLVALENVPTGHYDKVMLGLPGRDEQIENYQTTIRNMGKAGIPVLGFHWVPNGVWRSSSSTPDRGEARVTSFDYELLKDAPLSHGRIFTAEEMWDNYTYFIKAVAPVAEEAGVKLALHPDDPPVPMLGGVARIMSSFENFQRAMDIADSPAVGLDFCQGTWSEMGPGVLEAIRYFGSRGKIIYVHFRSVKGHVPKFSETFLNTGNVNMLEAMKAYKEVGFTGFFLDDHVPHISNDTPWSHQSRAYAWGYIQALLEMVES